MLTPCARIRLSSSTRPAGRPARNDRVLASAHARSSSSPRESSSAITARTTSRANPFRSSFRERSKAVLARDAIHRSAMRTASARRASPSTRSRTASSHASPPASPSRAIASSPSSATFRRPRNTRTRDESPVARRSDIRADGSALRQRLQSLLRSARARWAFQ